MDAETMNATDEYGIPIIPGPSDSAQRKRQPIIDAARADYLSECYSAATMDAIALRSRVSKS
ncbi:TetR/AcrR family transcriptional regulator, partial [Streptomyces goshikiensis]